MADNWSFQHTKFRCVICLKPDNLKLLPCLHLGCYSCLEELKNVQPLSLDSSLTCPKCGVSHNLGEEGIEKFLEANFLREKSHSPVYQNISFCTMCEAVGVKELSSHFCQQCKDNLCEVCTMRHLATSSTKLHTVMPLESDEYDEDLGNYHKEAESDECDEDLGNYHAEAKSDECNEDIGDYLAESEPYGEERSALQIKLGYMEGREADICGQMRLIDEIITRKERRHEDMTNELSEFKQMIFREIDDAFEKNVCDMKRITQEEIETLQKLKERLENTRESMGNAKTLAEKYLGNSTENYSTTGLNFFFKAVEKHCEKSKSEIVSNGRAALKKLSAEDIEKILKPLTQIIEVEKIQEVHENPLVELGFYPNRLAYLGDRLLICDQSNLCVCNQTGIVAFASDMGKIFDLCVHKDKVFVAHVMKCQSLVSVFIGENCSDVMKLPQEEQNLCTHPSYHLGITTDEKGNFYICSRLTNNIYEWQSGELMPSVYAHDCVKPYAMCFAPSNELLVTSIDAAKIYGYSQGKKVFDHDTKDVNDDIFLTGIGYDRMGNLFGCDFRHNNIYMIQLDSWSCKSTKLAFKNLNNPNAMAFHHGTIAIANQNQKNVAVWDMVMDI